MISYAQNLEDVMLQRAFGGLRDGFYIDAGAGSPLEDSVTKHFYDLGWRGINIEPSETYFQELQRDRPRDTNLNVALGDEQETRTFFEATGSGLSTLDPELVENIGRLGFEITTRREIPVTTLRAVCEKHVDGPIDFLKVDVEGWESRVLAGGDWSRYRPRIVLVEAISPVDGRPTWELWERDLLPRGYLFCYFDGLNRFYVRKEDSRLAQAFETPPNVTDGFIAYGRLRAEEDLRAADEERAKLDKDLGVLREEFSEQGKQLRRLLTDRKRWRSEVSSKLQELSRVRSELDDLRSISRQLRIDHDSQSQELRRQRERSRWQSSQYRRLETDHESRKRTLRDLENRAASRLTDLRRAYQEFHRLQDEARFLRARQQKMQSTWSWRLTDPIRRLGALLGPSPGKHRE
jgi:FkbM family methyltransferase